MSKVLSYGHAERKRDRGGAPRAGLSQRELALRLGKRQAEIARWERGHVVPSLERLREVVAACGLELTCGLAVADDSYDEQIVAGFSLPVGERLARVHRT